MLLKPCRLILDRVFLGIVLGVCVVVAYLFYMASLSSQWKAVHINRIFATWQLVCFKGFPFHCKKYNIFGRGFICWTSWGTYSCFYNISLSFSVDILESLIPSNFLNKIASGDTAVNIVRPAQTHSFSKASTQRINSEDTKQTEIVFYAPIEDAEEADKNTF